MLDLTGPDTFADTLVDTRYVSVSWPLSRACPAMYQLRTLGQLDLSDSAGQPVRAVLVQPKRFALLAYLAVASPRGFQRRDLLLTLFWPELADSRGRNALRQAVHQLRHVLGGDVIVSRSATPSTPRMSRTRSRPTRR